MWASKTDYAKLYSPQYFGKNTDVASFDIHKFPKQLVNFCHNLKLSHVLDVGSGSGALAQQLRNLNFNVTCCDYEPATKDSIHFDLTDNVENQKNTLADLTKITQAYLTTCFDVLEHIDIEDVPNAIINLYQITGEYGLFSISTRPSSADNAFHSTILPLATWEKLFEIAGFEILQLQDFQTDKFIFQPEQLNHVGMEVLKYWLEHDLFNDRQLGEPRYIFLKKRAGFKPETAAIKAKLAAMLDLDYREIKRTFFKNLNHKKIAFQINIFQDYLNLRPFLDMLERDDVTILIRLEELLPVVQKMLLGSFMRWGVKTIIYHKSAEIDWKKLNIDILVSACDSNVFYLHMLASQTVTAAKLAGIATYTLQHGIWIEPFANPVEFSAKHLLCWSDEQIEFFNTAHTFANGVESKIGLLSNKQALIVGCLKFADAANASTKDLLNYRLGIDVQNYKKIVLLGTNLKWGKHQTAKDQTSKHLEDMMKKNKDIFFILKTHPSEPAADYAYIQQPNCMIVDDILLGIIDFPISRLVASVDAVISSLSTLLLDGAIAGKKVILYDTDNIHHYKYLKPTALGNLKNHLSQTIDQCKVNHKFAHYYGGDASTKVYSNFEKLFAASKPYKPTNKDLIDQSHFNIAEQFIFQPNSHWFELESQDENQQNKLETLKISTLYQRLKNKKMIKAFLKITRQWDKY